MKIYRIPECEPKGLCHDCQGRAAIEVAFGGKRPPLRLCVRDACYLATRLICRIEEHEVAEELSAGHQGDRGNRL